MNVTFHIFVPALCGVPSGIHCTHTENIPILLHSAKIKRTIDIHTIVIVVLDYLSLSLEHLRKLVSGRAGMTYVYDQIRQRDMSDSY